MGASLMSRSCTSVVRFSSATLRTASCSSRLFSDAKGETGRITMGDAHDLLDELDDRVVYTPSSSLLSQWLLLGSMLVWLGAGLGCSNTGTGCSTGRSGEGGGGGGDAVSSSSSSFWSIMSLFAS